MADGALETGTIDKCIVQPAVIVERNAKYLLSQPELSLFSAASVLKKKAAVQVQEDLGIETTGNLKTTYNLRQ